LAFRAEVVVFDGFVFLGCEPAYRAGGAVFRANGGGPGEGIVDLDEVIVLLWSDSLADTCTSKKLK